MHTKSSDPFASRGFGDGASWLDFVNSELWDGYGNFTEMLDDPAWIRSFLRFWSMREPTTAAPQKQLRALRAQIRQLVEKIGTGKRLRLEDLSGINEWLKIPTIPQIEEGQNGWELALRPIDSGWHVILANIASSFARSLVEHEHKKLKICGNADCRWVFIDGSRNSTRRWCSNATCGNRARVRKARAGEKSAG